MSVGGRHLVIGVTAKQTTPPPSFVELGHLHPAPLPEHDRAAIADLVVAFLDAAGYRFGPAHTEVILTGSGPRIVESQARLGGDRIPLLVEIATGFDLEAAIFEALAGRPVTVPAAGRVASICFFQLPEGRVASVDGLAEITGLPYVHALKVKFQPGDEVPRIVDSSTRHGYVVVDAASAEEAADRLATVRDLLRVTTHDLQGVGR
jgi:biotin carboxylase